MAPEAWDALPWWQSTMYLEGLKKEGVIKDGSEPADSVPQVTPGKPSPPRTDPRVDYSSADLSSIPRGFKTRRAG